MKGVQTIVSAIVMHCFLLFTLYPTVMLAYDLPDMGDSTIHSISRTQEELLGREIMQKVRQSPLYNSDPIVTGYVRTLGTRLAAGAGHAHDDFYFFVINDPRVNAFALPGGYIGINAGLILVAENESEVAGVMAHEMAHVTQRHIARMFERSQSLSWPMMAALLGSLILASQNPALGSGAMATALAGANQDMINFTRSNEEEADRIGMQMLVDAQYDPNGMSTFFGRMAQANKYNDSFYVPDFLRTHPVNSARIADAKTRAQGYQVVPQGSELSFQLIRHRLQVLFGNPTLNTIAYYEAELKKPNKNASPAWHYGYSLALAEKGRFAEAEAQLLQLMATNRQEKIYRLTLAQVYQQQHQYPKALTVLKETLVLYPNDEAVVLQTAQALTDAKQYQEVRVLLEKQVRTIRNNPQYYHLLAQAQSKLNNPQGSYMARAEYYALEDDLHSAVRELKRAQAENKKSAYLQAKIAARLKVLEEQLELRDELQ